MSGFPRRFSIPPSWVDQEFVAMGIPESQLKTWANRSQTDTAIRAHTDVRSLLSSNKSLVKEIPYRDYLQGSYRNNTNIYRDHDVDIVVELSGSFFFDDSRLATYDSQRLRSHITPATYELVSFRDRVLKTLVSHFGASKVHNGNKAIRVDGVSGVRLDADVVVCEEYREYTSFTGSLLSGFVQGVKLWAEDDQEWIVNFPQQHYDNGVTKQEETDDWFKPTVRVFKNARNYLHDNSRLATGVAPSYFLQGLLYNVPRDRFGGIACLNFIDVLRWLRNNTERFPSFVCQNELRLLFDPSGEQWSERNATVFLRALAKLDDEWT